MSDYTEEAQAIIDEINERIGFAGLAISGPVNDKAIALLRKLREHDVEQASRTERLC